MKKINSKNFKLGEVIGKWNIYLEKVNKLQSEKDMWFNELSK